MNKILWCCNTQKGFDVLKKIISFRPEVIGLVCSYGDKKVVVDYGKKIRNLCKERDISFIHWSEFRSSPEEYIAEYNLTGIVAIGWQYLIPIQLNELLVDKIIVFHDSLLPRFRGFSPLPTAIIKGCTKTGVSVIYASSGMDEGNIILQSSMRIDKDEYIADSIKKMSSLYVELSKKLIIQLENNSISSTSQEGSPTYSVWRDKLDCEIKWGASSTDIHNLVRAVGNPYPGAYMFFNDEKVLINRTTIMEDIDFEVRDAGKFWKVEEGMPVVICGTGLIRIDEAVFAKTKSKFTTNLLRGRFS